MNKFLTRYIDILKKYKNGEFGNEHRTLYDIMSEAGESGILEKMNLSEIHTLTLNSSGLLKQMFFTLEGKKRQTLEKTKFF